MIGIGFCSVCTQKFTKKNCQNYRFLQFWAVFVASKNLVFDVVVCAKNAAIDSFYLLILIHLLLG